MIDDPLNRLKVKCGEQLPWAKLTEADVIEMRRLNERKRRMVQRLNEKYSAKGLAKRYGVHQRNVEKVLTGEIWGHIP